MYWEREQKVQMPRLCKRCKSCAARSEFPCISNHISTLNPSEMDPIKLWTFQLHHLQFPSLLFEKFVAPPRGAGAGSTTQVLPEYKRGQDGRTARELALGQNGAPGRWRGARWRAGEGGVCGMAGSRRGERRWPWSA